MNNNILKECNIIEINQSYSLSILLSTKCNLQCDFCDVIHSKDIDISDIKNIPKLLEENYPNELKVPTTTRLELTFKGGELFSDDINDNMFNIYKELCYSILILVRSYLPNIQINFSCISNGVTSKPERILKLFNDLQNSYNIKTTLFLSYDPIGRFKTKEQFEMFRNTFWYFYNKNRIPKIMTVLTKPNIDFFINNEDKFVENLPNNTSILLNYYMPNENFKKYLPNDDNLYNFFIWSINNDKFQFNLINNLINIIYYFEFKPRSCSPSPHTIYFKGNIYQNTNCDIFNPSLKEPELRPKRYYEDYAKSFIQKDQIDIKRIISLEKRGCLSCEYKKICTEPCWCTMFQSTECFSKRTIQYLYDHPEVKNKYELFMEKRK